MATVTWPILPQEFNQTPLLFAALSTSFRSATPMFFDQFFERLSVLSGGIPADNLKIAFSVLLTYPYAVIFNNLPNNPQAKHLFSIFITTITFAWFHELYVGFIHLITGILMTYAIMKYNRGKWAPVAVFVLTMAHMSYCHIVRQMEGHLGDAGFDHTGPQMVLTMKLTSFAFNVYDGTKLESKLSEYQRSKQIRTFPSLIEYMGWALFFGGFLGGPAFEFADYKNFVDMTVFTVKDEKTGKTKMFKPNGTVPALRKLGLSFVFVVVLATVAPHFNVQAALKPEWASEAFWKKYIVMRTCDVYRDTSHHPIVAFSLSLYNHRFLFVQVVSFCVRVKYYIIWLMAEGACILCGLGFNGYDAKTGTAKWNRVPNIDVVGYETAQNIKELLESWNMRTNVWLKNYVYLRVTPPGAKPGFLSTLVTFGTSALWHGFHPGYY
ncbi:MBOAT, membrane-bound O-acyltransferase family-domain-containing protein, partial [Jimgerdemannia flammicorona]